jgi:hypothetical protein
LESVGAFRALRRASRGSASALRKPFEKGLIENSKTRPPFCYQHGGHFSFLIESF